MSGGIVADVEVPAPMRLGPRPKYLSLALAALHRSIAYRTTTLMTTLANLIWVAVLYYLWQAVFTAQSQIAGYDWGQMRAYILVSYAVNSLLSFYTESRMIGTIRTGEVATELMRPIDYMGAQLAQAVGAAVVEGGLGSVLALGAAVLFLGVTPPQSPLLALVFVASVALGFLVKFLISYLTGLLCFWTTSALGLLWARAAITNVFSGALIPLTFFPDWLQPVVLAAPFQAIVYTPVSIYLGRLQGTAILTALGVQLFWVVVLWALARLLWHPSVKALTVQGG